MKSAFAGVLAALSLTVAGGIAHAQSGKVEAVEIIAYALLSNGSDRGIVVTVGKLELRGCAGKKVDLYARVYREEFPTAIPTAYKKIVQST